MDGLKHTAVGTTDTNYTFRWKYKSNCKRRRTAQIASSKIEAAQQEAHSTWHRAHIWKEKCCSWKKELTYPSPSFSRTSNTSSGCLVKLSSLSFFSLLQKTWNKVTGNNWCNQLTVCHKNQAALAGKWVACVHNNVVLYTFGWTAEAYMAVVHDIVSVLRGFVINGW